MKDGYGNDFGVDDHVILVNPHDDDYGMLLVVKSYAAADGDVFHDQWGTARDRRDVCVFDACREGETGTWEGSTLGALVVAPEEPDAHRPLPPLSDAGEKGINLRSWAGKSPVAKRAAADLGSPAVQAVRRMVELHGNPSLWTVEKRESLWTLVDRDGDPIMYMPAVYAEDVVGMLLAIAVMSSVSATYRLLSGDFDTESGREFSLS